MFFAFWLACKCLRLCVSSCSVSCISWMMERRSAEDLRYDWSPWRSGENNVSPAEKSVRKRWDLRRRDARYPMFPLVYTWPVHSLFSSFRFSRLVKRKWAQDPSTGQVSSCPRRHHHLWSWWGCSCCPCGMDRAARLHGHFRPSILQSDRAWRGRGWGASACEREVTHRQSGRRDRKIWREDWRRWWGGGGVDPGGGADAGAVRF